MEILNNKPLLELLSPFADKTLSEGCIVISTTSCITRNDKFKVYGRKWENGPIFMKYLGDGDLLKDLEETNGDNKNIKILGQIGIITVFNLLTENEYGIDGIYGDNIIFYDKNGYKENIKILKKELNLYTKKELEKLYNSLKELG